MPHPDGAICESLPPAIDEIGHGLVQCGGMAGGLLTLDTRCHKCMVPFAAWAFWGGVPNQCLINSYIPGQGIDAHSNILRGLI